MAAGGTRVGRIAFWMKEWHKKWTVEGKPGSVMLCGVRVFLLGYSTESVLGKKRKMRLLRVKQVHRGPWMHCEEEKITLCHNSEDSFSSPLLLLLDSKPTSCGASHFKPCPAGVVWSFRVSLHSQRGHFLHLRQVNVLCRAQRVRQNLCCTFSMFSCLTGVYNEVSMVLLVMQADRSLLVGTPPSGPWQSSSSLRHHLTAMPVALWVYRAGLRGCSVASTQAAQGQKLIRQPYNLAVRGTR